MGTGKKVTVGYKYKMGMHMIICHSADAVLEIQAGDRTAWTGNVTSSQEIFINSPELFGGEKKEGGIVGKVDILMGEPSQGKNSYLVSQLGEVIPAFRGVVSIVLKKVYLAAMNPYPKPWAFKVRRIPGKEWYPAKANIGGSANAAHIIYDCITSSEYGMGHNISIIDLASFTEVADTLYDEGLGLSFVLSNEDNIENFIYSVMAHVNGMFYTRPDTGQFAIKLLRDNYDANTLPLYDESNIVKLESFERATYGEMINEIVVMYRPQGSSKDDSVTVQDLAAIQAQEGIISQTVKYPGIDNAQNAARVALRDLRQKSTPLARVRIRVTRNAWNVTIGDCIRFSWAEQNVSNMILRVLDINLGKLGSSDILIICVEDVFGLPSATYIGDQVSGWVDPVSQPEIASFRKIYEAPYWDILRYYSEAEAAYLTSTSSYLLSAIGETPKASMNYELWTKTGSVAYSKADDGSFCAHGLLTTAVTKSQTSFTLNTLRGNIDEFTVGEYAIIDNEFVRVDSINTDTGVITVGRGCLDTVPAEHAVGARIYFAGGNYARDLTEYATGETVNAKTLTRTGIGLLAINSAPQDTLAMVGRYNKPYPPGNFKINGAYWPASISGDLSVTWAHRDRSQQLATIIDHTSGNIGPEASVTYTIRLYDENDSLFVTQSAISGTSYSISAGSEASILGLTYTVPRNEVYLNNNVDPDWASVVLLLPMETDFNDLKGHAVTLVGPPTIGGSNPAPYGSNCGNFGSGKYVQFADSADFVLATSYTFEAWIRPATQDLSNIHELYNQRSGGGTGIQFGLSSGKVFHWVNGTTYFSSTGPALVAGTAYHIAYVKNGTNFKVFLNGVTIVNITASYTPPNIAAVVTIGGDASGNGQHWYGQMKDVRLTSGVARYTADFTPPSSPYPTGTPSVVTLGDYTLGRGNGKMRVTLESVRGSVNSLQAQEAIFDRVGYGYQYGKYYGG